jgi:hypothetical protein
MVKPAFKVLERYPHFSVGRERTDWYEIFTRGTEVVGPIFGVYYDHDSKKVYAEAITESTDQRDIPYAYRWGVKKTSEHVFFYFRSEEDAMLVKMLF